MKIHNDQLTVRTSTNGVVTAYTIDLEIISCEDSKKILLENYKKELRFLLRSQTNLQEASLTLMELASDHYGESNNYIKDPTRIAHRALLSHAVMMYRACFLKGEGREVPLKFLLKELSENSIHLEISDLRDKLFAHLDENHSVRNDHIKWELKVEEDKLVPIRANLIGDNLHSYHKSTLNDWLRHFHSVLDKIKEKEDFITKEINEMIGEINWKY